MSSLVVAYMYETSLQVLTTGPSYSRPLKEEFCQVRRSELLRHRPSRRHSNFKLVTAASAIIKCNYNLEQKIYEKAIHKTKFSYTSRGDT